MSKTRFLNSLFFKWENKSNHLKLPIFGSSVKTEKHIIYKIVVVVVSKMDKKIGKKAKCPKCGHEWLYKGKGRYYLTCPCCYRKVSIEKTIIEKKEKKKD